MEYFRCWICIVFQWNTLLLVLQAWADVDLHTECGLRPWATLTTFLLSSHSLSRVVNSWPLFFALCAISLLLFSFSPPRFCLPLSVFHPPTSAFSPHNNIIREFLLLSPRRLHLLRTHATRSAPTPDWQVYERVQDCRAGEVKSDRVQWETLALQTFAATSDPPLPPTEVSGLKWRDGWWREGGTVWGNEGEGVLVCGVACCVQVLELVTIGNKSQFASLSPSCVWKTVSAQMHVSSVLVQCVK